MWRRSKSKRLWSHKMLMQWKLSYLWISKLIYHLCQSTWTSLSICNSWSDASHIATITRTSSTWKISTYTGAYSNSMPSDMRKQSKTSSRLTKLRKNSIRSIMEAIVVIKVAWIREIKLFSTSLWETMERLEKAVEALITLFRAILPISQI